jgi:PAS domain S-box-containing protein
MNEGLTVLDKDMRLVLVNDRFCQMVGRRRSELMGRRATKLYDAANRAVLKRQLARRRRGAANPYEIALTRKDGRRLFALISPSILHDARGRFCGSFAVITDITERKEMEAVIQQARDELEKRVKERTAELRRTNDELRAEILERTRTEQALRALVHPPVQLM